MADDDEVRDLTTCGCTLHLATGKRTYCAAHKDQAKPTTPKAMALEALARAYALVEQGRRAGDDGLDELEWVTLRSYLEVARDNVQRIEELKRARPTKREDGTGAQSAGE